MRYCFDIDGTICSTNCEYEDAKPYKEVVNKINSLYNSGNIIILFTNKKNTNVVLIYRPHFGCH